MPRENPSPAIIKSCIVVGAAYMLIVAPFRPAAAAPPSPQLEADRAALVQGNTRFALDLYGRLRDKEGNLFFSPYSVSTALALTYAGARGDTADQIVKTLHFPVAGERLHRACAGLMPGNDRGVHLANALWGQKRFGIREEFRTEARGYYGAGLGLVDFENDPEQARRTINAWIAGQTQYKIKDAIAPGTLDTQTRLVLASAIHFRGAWFHEFKKSHTKDGPFHVGTDHTVMVPLMRQTDQFRYLSGDGFQLLQLGYRNTSAAMVILLPRKVEGLAAFEKELSSDRLADWLKKAEYREVEVTLPRFRITQEFDLAGELQAMGMRDAFSHRDADFKGISEEQQLYLYAVLHKAFVHVNEQGTEAAAATALILKKAPDDLEDKPAVFTADHPFVFLIYDRANGSILFMGRVANPK